MNTIIYDPSYHDPLSASRGGGRFVNLLQEHIPHARFVHTIQEASNKDVLVIPFFKPFEKPILTKRIAKKQILVIYDVIPLKYPTHFPVGLRGGFNLWRNKQALKHYDIVVTISHHSKKDITHYLNIPEEKIEVIYPTINNNFLSFKSQQINSNNQIPNPKKIRNPNNQNSKQKNFENSSSGDSNLFGAWNVEFCAYNYCLYVGDVNWNKNLVNLAKAVKIANILCVFVGKNFSSRKFLLSKLTHQWQKEFRDFLEEIGDDPRFIFAGYVSDHKLINLYKQSLMNILISHDEGFGFSYLEASTLGCVSILSDTTIFHEIAKGAATFVNPDNPQAIASKIMSISNNAVLRQKLSFEAQERAKYFSQDLFKNQWQKIIQS